MAPPSLGTPLSWHPYLTQPKIALFLENIFILFFARRGKRLEHCYHVSLICYFLVSTIDQFHLIWPVLYLPRDGCNFSVLFKMLYKGERNLRLFSSFLEDRNVPVSPLLNRGDAVCVFFPSLQRGRGGAQFACFFSFPEGRGEQFGCFIFFNIPVVSFVIELAVYALFRGEGGGATYSFI